MRKQIIVENPDRTTKKSFVPLVFIFLFPFVILGIIEINLKTNYSDQLIIYLPVLLLTIASALIIFYKLIVHFKLNFKIQILKNKLLLKKGNKNKEINKNKIKWYKIHDMSNNFSFLEIYFINEKNKTKKISIPDDYKNIYILEKKLNEWIIKKKN